MELSRETIDGSLRLDIRQCFVVQVDGFDDAVELLVVPEPMDRKSSKDILLFIRRTSTNCELSWILQHARFRQKARHRIHRRQQEF